MFYMENYLRYLPTFHFDKMGGFPERYPYFTVVTSDVISYNAKVLLCTRFTSFGSINLDIGKQFYRGMTSLLSRERETQFNWLLRDREGKVPSISIKSEISGFLLASHYVGIPICRGSEKLALFVSQNP